MSLAALAWAFDQDELPCVHKMVLLALANHCDMDGKCWPSQKTIAKKAGISRKRVNTIVGELEMYGYISISPQTRPNGSDTSNLYILNCPKEKHVASSRAPVPGFLYIATDGSKFKVGITRDVAVRMRGIATASGNNVELVAKYSMPMDSARRCEKALLEALKQYKVRGEWLSCDLVQIIDLAEKLSTPPEDQPEGDESAFADGRRIFNSMQDKVETALAREPSSHPLRTTFSPPENQVLTHNQSDIISHNNQDLCPTASDIEVPRSVKPKSQAYTQEFDEFWQSYPDRTNNSKIRAYAEWQKLSVEDRILAVKGIPAFVAYCKKNKDYRAVHCERYLSQRRFDSWAASPSPSAVQYFRV